MVKKIQLLLSIFLFSSVLAFGQSYIGVFGGINMSKLSGDVPAKAKYKSLTGMNVGANLDIKLSDNMFLSLQPSYSQEGTKISYTLPGALPIDSISVRLNYFSLPVLLKITTGNERFYALAGIETSLLLNSSQTIDDTEQDLDVDVTELNLAMQFGVGLRIPIGFPRLFVELRYSQGLLNLTDDPIAQNSIPRVKTSGMKIFVGIEIPLKKSEN
ncbi:MAG: hypothetical protein DRI69_06575 [Bacteroidetes bacterium]|nr:MAG: hypothetical protein DRI69_06575 [Bacteroidota bacterium]